MAFLFIVQTTYEKLGDIAASEEKTSEDVTKSACCDAEDKAEKKGKQYIQHSLYG